MLLRTKVSFKTHISPYTKSCVFNFVLKCNILGLKALLCSNRTHCSSSHSSFVLHFLKRHKSDCSEFQTRQFVQQLPDTTRVLPKQNSVNVWDLSEGLSTWKGEAPKTQSTKMNLIQIFCCINKINKSKQLILKAWSHVPHVYMWCTKKYLKLSSIWEMRVKIYLWYRKTPTKTSLFLGV